jgi:hypothetical protein
VRHRRIVEHTDQVMARSRRAGNRTIAERPTRAHRLPVPCSRARCSGPPDVQPDDHKRPWAEQRLYALGTPLVEILAPVPLFA